jgi:hypothetical protein
MVRGARMSEMSITRSPACQQPAQSSSPKRSAWCRRLRRPTHVGFSPPATCWPGIHQRDTSSGRAGLRMS